MGLRELNDIDNISYREDGKVITTKYVSQTTTDFPSPYLTGVFDDLLDDGVNFSAVFETNRGCPNQCSYCDWGEPKTKVRLFPMEPIKAEIDWFAEHKIEFIYAADANFGLFSRDIEIAQALYSLGLLKNISLFYRFEFVVRFASFYRMIIEFSQRKDMPLLNRIYLKIHTLCHKIARQENGFLTTCEALFKYQYDVIKKIGVKELTVTLDYDFYTYFNNILQYNYEPLKKQHLSFTVKDEAVVKDLSEYVRQVIWYGRNKRLTDYSSSFYKPFTTFNTD